MEFKGIAHTDWTGWEFDFSDGHHYRVLENVNKNTVFGPGIDTLWLLLSDDGTVSKVDGGTLLNVYAMQMTPPIGETSEQKKKRAAYHFNEAFALMIELGCPGWVQDEMEGIQTWF